MSTVIELCGYAAFVIAGWLITPALGFAVAGVALVVIAHALDGQPIPGADRARQLLALAQRLRQRLSAMPDTIKEREA